MLATVRYRAKKDGIPFTVTESDLWWPDVCPVLGIPLIYRTARKGGRTGGASNSPSLDRIDPQRGYVDGNVIVISTRANRIKNDANVAELRAVADWLEAVTNIPAKGDIT